MLACRSAAHHDQMPIATHVFIHQIAARSVSASRAGHLSREYAMQHANVLCRRDIPWNIASSQPNLLAGEDLQLLEKAAELSDSTAGKTTAIQHICVPSSLHGRHATPQHAHERTYLPCLACSGLTQPHPNAACILVGPDGRTLSSAYQRAQVRSDIRSRIGLLGGD